jgi:hypothetical protein
MHYVGKHSQYILIVDHVHDFRYFVMTSKYIRRVNVKSEKRSVPPWSRGVNLRDSSGTGKTDSPEPGVIPGPHSPKVLADPTLGLEDLWRLSHDRLFAG